MIRLRRTCKVTDNPKTPAILCSPNLTPTSTSSSTSLPHPPQPPLHIPSCASSTSTKPTSPTSVDRHRGHRLTDIGDVGLEAVEEGEMRKWGVVTCGSFGGAFHESRKALSWKSKLSGNRSDGASIRSVERTCRVNRLQIYDKTFEMKCYGIVSSSSGRPVSGTNFYASPFFSTCQR